MTNPTDSLNQLALNKAVQCYMEYPGRAEIRPLVTAIIEAYLRCGEILDNTITDGVRPEQESSPVEVAQNGDNVSPSSRQPVDSPMELLKLILAGLS